MKRSVDLNEDQLREYLKPGTIEKAPEGLTEKIMFQVQTQKKYVPVKYNFLNKDVVPIVYCGITILLIILSLILPYSSDNIINLPILNSLVSFKDMVLKFVVGFLSGFRIPSMIIYIPVAFFMLVVLDYVLSSVFYRKHSQEK
jgi:hypothetical protein